MRTIIRRIAFAAALFAAPAAWAQTILTRAQLSNDVNTFIKTNGVGAITGPILNSVLQNIINSEITQADTSNILNGSGIVVANGASNSITFTPPGNGILNALGVNIGSPGAPVLYNGAGGTPSSMILTNATLVPGSTILLPTTNGGVLFDNNGVLGDSTTLPSGLTIPNSTLSGSIAIPGIGGTGGFLYNNSGSIASSTAAAGVTNLTINGPTSITGPTITMVDQSGANTGNFINFWAIDTHGGGQLGGQINGGLSTNTYGAYTGDIDFIAYGPGNTQQVHVAIDGEYSMFGPSADNAYNLGHSGLRWSNIWGVNGEFGGLMEIGSSTITPAYLAQINTGVAKGTTSTQFPLTLNSDDPNASALSLEFIIGSNSNASANYTALQSIEVGTSYRALVLNPNGGSVIVGANTADSYLFEVNGTAKVDNGLTVASSFTATGLVTNADLAYSTISGIALGNNLDTLTFGTHLTSGASSYNGSAAATITSDATSANTASTIVARDGSGNFSAGTITAALTGHASLDLALSSLGTNVATALGVNIGSPGAPVLYNGAGGTPSSLTLTNATGLPNGGLLNSTISGIALGNNLDTLTFGTHLAAGGSSYNGSAGVTITSDATNANTASTIVARDSSGNFSAGTITASLTGHASSDCALAGCTMSGAIAMGANAITGASSVTSPSLIGGSATTQTMTIESTTGAGSGDTIQFNTGSQATILTLGDSLITASATLLINTTNELDFNALNSGSSITGRILMNSNTLTIQSVHNGTAYLPIVAQGSSVDLIGTPYLSSAPSGSLASYYACFDPSSSPVGEISYQATNCTTSLRSTKHDLLPYTTGLADAMALHPETFVMNHGTDGRRQIGLIAEDVQGEQDMLAGYQDGKLRTVQYDRVGVVAIGAVQAQQGEIETLSARIDALEGANDNLRRIDALRTGTE